MKLCLFSFIIINISIINILCDKFDIADNNHDGLLDRQEYSLLMKELKDSIDPFLILSSTSTSSSSSSEIQLKPSEQFNNFLNNLFKGTMAEDFISGVVNSLVVIWVTEIGDKTFFIAAVLAMRNGRTIVYLGCMGINIFSSLFSFLLKFFFY